MSFFNQVFRRKALTRPNLPYLWWRYVGNAKRAMLAWQAPFRYSEAPRIAGELTDQGIVLGPSDRFLSREGCEALAAASDLVLGISRGQEAQAILAKGESNYKKSYLVNLVDWDKEHQADSPLVKLALDRKLLEIVSAYLGLSPRLHAIGAWLNFPTAGEAVEAQLWHRDPEDMKIVKVFIYLVNVDEQCGPFTYIPKTHPFSVGAAKIPKHRDRKRITDDEMRAVFPPESWRVCTGPANTMILADTVGYHRGGKPTNGNRILITFTYTSGAPLSNRRLRVSGRPTWAMDDRQRLAL